MRGAGWALARLPWELAVEQGRLLDAPPPTCNGGSQRKGFACSIGNLLLSPVPALQEGSMELAGKRVPLENNIQPRLEEDALQRDLKKRSSLHSSPCCYHIPAPVWWPPPFAVPAAPAFFTSLI